MSIKQGLKFKKNNFVSKTWSLFYDLAQLSSCKYDANINPVVLKTAENLPSNLGSLHILAKLPGLGLGDEKS